MPHLSGMELCQRLRTVFKESFTYIILVTSISEISNIAKALEAGADDYITKPFYAAELLARVKVGRRFIGIHRQLEAKNQFLEQLALTDELTGLPNRRVIEQWASRQLSGALRHHFPFWVIMADLDRFKSINDTYGHDTGDVASRKFVSLFAALEVHTGKVKGRCAARHTGEAFVGFLDQAVVGRQRRQIHLILDNLAVHKTPGVQTWLNSHPNVHLHFTPTYASWQTGFRG